MKTSYFLLIISLFLSLLHTASASAQNRSARMPSLPTGGLGLQGSAGIGFVDFTTTSPSDDFDVDRGTMVAVGLERGFEALHLYLTLGLNYMSANGKANYNYTTGGTTYTATDIKFDSSITDLTLGLKFKIIDNYWFRPYVEGGGIAGYHQIEYTNKHDTLAATGPDYKARENIMGSGHYGEAGLEAMFSEKFGVKLAARKTWYRTKEIETLGDRVLKFNTESYYFAALFGF